LGVKLILWAAQRLTLKLNQNESAMKCLPPKRYTHAIKHCPFDRLSTYTNVPKDECS